MILTQFEHDGKTYEVGAEVYMKHSIPGKLELTKPYYLNGKFIPVGFEWDGASSPGIPVVRAVAPKFYKNIKASLVHDWLCSKARNKKERKAADKWYYMMKKYAEQDSSVKSWMSYVGVRIGAFFGIGNRF